MNRSNDHFNSISKKRCFSKQNKLKQKEIGLVFVVFSDPYQELTLVRTGFLDDLISNYRVVVMVGSALIRDHLQSHFGTSAIDVILYEDRQPSRSDQLLQALLTCKYEKNAGPFRRAQRNAARLKKSLLGKFKSLVLYMAAKIAPEKVLLLVQNCFLSDQFLDNLYKRYKPILTVLTWGGAYGPCPMVIRSATKLGCKTISVDATWDCMDELAVIPKVDKLLVWNEAMKEEAIARHRYDPRNVSVVGPLRCDFYRRKEYKISKEAFFEAHGFDTNRRLITIAINRGDPETYCRLVDLLIKADEERQLCHPIQIYVRLAPWSYPHAFQRISKHNLVRVEASYHFEGKSLVQEKEIIETVNLLLHTNILVSVLSTLILESAYFDIPNISLHFPEFKSLYERDFLHPLSETGGVTFVDDIPAVLQAVNKYLISPEQDANGRNAILNRLCHGGDGQVNGRVLSEIEQLIRK
jgi:hypothetical protein